MNHRGHTHIDDSFEKKKVRLDVLLLLSRFYTCCFFFLFLMDTTEQEQETPRHKSMKSEIISHQLQLACKKNQSNSINGDLEHDEK